MILAGEHFVVLGAPAIAMAINLYSHVTASARPSKNIDVEATIPLQLLGRKTATGPSIDPRRVLEPLRLAARETLDHIGEKTSGAKVAVDCEIPIGAGLGSSAATTVSIITAIAAANHHELTKPEVFEIAFGPESYLHGKPSGVDQAAAIYGGVIKFTKPDKVTRIRLKTPLNLVVCDTGVHRETRKLVGSVVRRAKKVSYDRDLIVVKEICRQTARMLARGAVEELGVLMNLNHELLKKIGVSHPRIEQLIGTAIKRGALGAKLTGAGGGGCIIALCGNHKEEMAIARALKRKGGIPYRISMDTEGARVVQEPTGLEPLRTRVYGQF